MSTAQAIKQKVKHLRKGQPFGVEAFADCGSSTAVRKSLSRLVKRGELVRPAQGVYARPKPNRFFGYALPAVNEVARVVAERNGETLEVHGAEAARQLGLSTQSPIKLAFYTSGSTRQLKVGATEVHFEHLKPAYLKYAGTPTGKAIAAFLHLGHDGVTPNEVVEVYRRLPAEDQSRFEQAVPTLPKWLREAFVRGQEIEDLVV